jgi:hypothetical protein
VLGKKSSRYFQGNKKKEEEKLVMVGKDQIFSANQPDSNNPLEFIIE